jgi:hypothetical protein
MKDVGWSVGERRLWSLVRTLQEQLEHVLCRQEQLLAELWRRQHANSLAQDVYLTFSSSSSFDSPLMIAQGDMDISDDRVSSSTLALNPMPSMAPHDARQDGSAD